MTPNLLKSIKRALLFVTLLASVPAYGQKAGYGAVSGMVKTTDGKPAALVNVVLKDTFYGALTDPDGKFRFDAPAGKYTMQVFSIRAHTREIPVEVKQGEELHLADISIIEDLKSFDEVVVTGQFSPQSMRNSVYNVRVVGARKIEAKAANNVQAVLNTELGVRMSNDMALGETDFELMGMGGNNVKVMIDGVPMVDRGDNRQSLSQIDVNTIDRIEIVEGPMSVVYGTDALAGVINIITKKGEPAAEKDKWMISAGFQEESAGSEYNFFNGKGIHRQNLQLGWTGRSGIYAGGGFTRYSSGGWRGYRTGRELTWQPKDQYIYNALLGFKRKELDVWYRLDYLDEELVTYSNGTEAEPQNVSDKKFIADRFTHQLQADWKVSNRTRLNLATSYQDFDRNTRTIWTDTDTGEQWLSEGESDQDDSNIKTFFARGTATWQTAPKFTLQPGVEYQWSKGSGDRINGEPRIADLALYVSAEWRPLKWLNVRPGVRSIVNSDYDAPLAIPALLAKMSLTGDIDLRLSYAYGFRSPTLRELYMSYHNPNHNIEGNPNLKAESSNNVTGAVTWRALHGGDVRLTSTLSGFYNRFSNRIDIVLVDDTSNPPGYSYGNISRYRTTGGTLENTLHWRNLHATLGMSYIGRYNQLKDNDEYNDERMTSYRWSPEVNASIMYSLEKSGTDLNLFYKFTGKRDSYYVSNDEISLMGLESYSWADFTVVQRVHEYVKISAGVKNIFDVSMVKNTAGGRMTSSGNASLVGYGRSYFLGATFLLKK